ncbi:MAG: hypothetical protein ACFFER_06480 [Candidatus Thorarchaeota archaeon]
MFDDHAAHPDEIEEGQGPSAIGWGEIKNALQSIENMRRMGVDTARLVLIETTDRSRVRVTLYTMEDL